MARRVIQQYGIKYPFTTNSDTRYFVDTNLSLKNKIRSILMHIIFTPKGQKIRDPEFGTDLVKNIFEPNENETWAQIQAAISKAINRYLPEVLLNRIEMLKNEDNASEIFVKIQYSVKKGSTVEQDSIIATL